MAQGEPEHEAIQQAIASWPIEEQIALARGILERAGVTAIAQPAGRSTWEALYGLAANSGQEPPSDEQVARWLDERRTNKYGR